tara:strand:- start:620 stop:1351 length:732 start_codon:yes stop_codon:yes gene_type:complete
MNKSILVSARSGSKRLPQKPYLKIQDREIITYLFENIKKSNVAQEVFLATTTKKEDDLLCSIALDYNLKVFRGDSEDKLNRWLSCCLENQIDYFVNVDGDDIFFDYELADYVLKIIDEFDFIDGSGLYNDVYGININALKKVCNNKKTIKTEFVRPFFLNEDSLKVLKLTDVDKKYTKTDFRMTLDYDEDYIFFKNIIESLNEYSFDNVLNYLENNPEIKKINYFLDEEWRINQQKEIGKINL